MPKVGTKEFPYTPAGMKQAEEEAAKTGFPIEKTQRYQAGGEVLKSHSVKKKTRGTGAATRGLDFYTT